MREHPIEGHEVQWAIGISGFAHANRHLKMALKAAQPWLTKVERQQVQDFITFLDMISCESGGMYKSYKRYRDGLRDSKL